MVEFQEIINENGHILYCTPEAYYLKNSSKILGLDLDWTIIKPIKGKIHPLDDTDWHFLDYNMSKIREKIDDGYKFVIFTNQGGLLKEKSGRMNLEGFKKRWHNIYDIFKNKYNIHSIYLLISLYDDFNRKPCTGMWDYVEKHLNGNVKVNRAESLYVGDMAGRKNDHSYSDLMFAINCGVNFEVPEVFFETEYSNLISNKKMKLLKNMFNDDKVFNPNNYVFNEDIEKQNLNVANSIKQIIELDSQKDSQKDNINKNIIIYVGSPASGKSHFLENYIVKTNVDKYLTTNKIVLMNSDTFSGTITKFNKTIDENMKNNKINSIIIDNTNGTFKTREKIIKIAKNNNYNVYVIYFDTSKEITMHLNAIRTKLNNICILKNIDSKCSHNVPAVAINTFWKRFELPDKTKENITEIYTIKFNNFSGRHNLQETNKFNLLLI